jgi:hypothetical protein
MRTIVANFLNKITIETNNGTSGADGIG